MTRWFSETAPGRFASDPVPFETLGSFLARVEAHLVDLSSNAAPRVVENLRKIREQIGSFEAKIEALEAQPGDHGKATRALRVALESRRSALRRLLATHGGFAETTLPFVVHPVPVVLAGDGQNGLIGEFLPSPLVAGMARIDRTTRLPVENITFRWSVEAGTLEFPTTLTDQDGATRNRFRLPASSGPVTIRTQVEVDGFPGPVSSFTARAEHPETPPIEEPPPLVVRIVTDDRTNPEQRALLGRGKGLLPLIVRVEDPRWPLEALALVTVEFHVVEGSGCFVHAEDHSILTNSQGEAGIYFVPTRPGLNRVRARVAHEPSNEVFFSVQADPPRIELVLPEIDPDNPPTDLDASKRPVYQLPGSAVSRLFRVRVTDPDGFPLAGSWSATASRSRTASSSASSSRAIR